MDKRILLLALPFILLIMSGYLPYNLPDNSGRNNGNFPYSILSNPRNMAGVDSKKLDANQISTWYRTNGSFNMTPETQEAGFEWPKGSGKFARFASGLWLGCIVGNDTLTAVAVFSFDFLPGYIDGNGNPQGFEDPAYKVYKISSGNTTDPDYMNWPFSQGAYSDSAGNPLNLGTQTMFYVYTDGYTHSSGQTSLRSLKVQILQTNWAYNVNGALGNIIFQEYRIINRSSDVWTNTYLAQWTDDDLGYPTDDKVGCDTNLDLGYTYNASNNDQYYGAAPPAVGFDFFRGASVQTGNPNDSLFYYSPPGSNNYIVKHGWKDLGMTVFNYYNNTNPEPSDPRNNTETYRVLEGKQRLGDSWIDPNGNVSLKVFNGDPVAAAGWLNPGNADRRFLQSTGPFTMNPGDTQVIVVAQVIARGASNLLSVKALRLADDLAQRIFDANFQVPESAPEVLTNVYAPGNGKIYLSWSDTAEKRIIPNRLSRGYYEFQGYNIYAIKTGTNGSESSDRILITTFDKRDGITDISDSVLSTVFETYVYYVVQKGYDNGISRFFVIDRDYINNTFISNGTEYDVVVTAYYYDSLGGPRSAPKINETPITASNILRIIPQELSSGIIVSYKIGDTIKTSQRDLGVVPIVTDPLKLISARYESVLTGTNSNPLWNLTKIYNGTSSVLYQNQTDFSGLQDTAKTVDGFILIHQKISDSGIVRDPDNASVLDTTGNRFYTNRKAWSYYPEANLWLTAPDTSAVKLVGNSGNRSFDSRSLGFGFPTVGSFRNTRSRIFATGTEFKSISTTNTILTGGPLRRVKIVFGVNSMAYRFLPDTVNANSTPYAGMVQVPFSVYAFDELDSTWINGPRQLNVGFVDSNRNSQWDPSAAALGGSNFTYIFASNYDPNPSVNYTNKNPGTSSPVVGLPSLDIMYIWLPRVRTVNNVPLMWSSGDSLIIYPYRITRSEFVAGFPVKYSWTVSGTQVGNVQTASSQLREVKAFPNPYYGGSRLETDPFNRFIYISHLPSKCKIFVYTLDGILIRSIDRNNNDPNNSLEKWDLKNANDIPVASGMYIIFIDAGSIGMKTLKVAIFTPQERLDTF